jgi:hypothetical protein
VAAAEATHEKVNATVVTLVDQVVREERLIFVVVAIDIGLHSATPHSRTPIDLPAHNLYGQGKPEFPVPFM